MQIIKIGRNSNNDVVVNDSLVSRFHCQIIKDDNGNYRLDDLNSLNGTFVNGMRCSGQVTLSPTDIVRIGETTLPWQNYFGHTASTAGETMLGASGTVASPQPVNVGAQRQTKERHGFVTFWLVLGIIFTVISIIRGIYGFVKIDGVKESISDETYTLSLAMMLVVIIQGLLQILFYGMILNWKKAGFWGILTVSVVGCAITSVLTQELLNEAGGIGFSVALSVASVIITAVSLVILWAVLQIRKNGVSCWSQLE